MLGVLTINFELTDQLLRAFLINTFANRVGFQYYRSTLRLIAQIFIYIFNIAQFPLALKLFFKGHRPLHSIHDNLKNFIYIFT